MAKTRRNSIENMFAKKGSVQPQKKEVVEEAVQEPIEEKPEEKVAEKKEHVEEVVVVTNEENIDKDEPKENISPSIDNIFNKTKRERGKQQTIYFKKEVYDFCNEISEKYEVGISDVVNKLILSIMED